MDNYDICLISGLEEQENEDYKSTREHEVWEQKISHMRWDEMDARMLWGPGPLFHSGCC